MQHSASPMKYVSLFLLTLWGPFFSVAQQPTSEEKLLYDLIMQYRKENNLPPVALSKSLTMVAQTHAKDLIANRPNQGRCNLHSWSANGSWTACCYTPDHAQAACMWSKPRELTNYKGNGYEIACSTSALVITAEIAINTWKKSRGHNELILNLGIWKSFEWKVIGIGINGGVAVIWFGSEPDVDPPVVSIP